MEKENFCMLIKQYMKETGKMIKPMDLECSSIRIKQDIQVNGKMISSMDMAKKIGLMVQYIKEISKKVKNMDKVMIIFIIKETMFGMMDHNIQENGVKIR